MWSLNKNHTASIGGVLAGGAFIGSAGSGIISSAARIDYAEAAAIVLLSENNKGDLFDDSGALSKLIGRPATSLAESEDYNNLKDSKQNFFVYCW